MKLIAPYEEFAWSATAPNNRGEKLESGWRFFCPGCGYEHHLRVWCKEGRPVPAFYAQHRKWPLWTFDGNEAAPSFTPSLRLSGSAPGKEVNGKWVATGPAPTLCHVVIQKGVLNFCGDCAHSMRGQRVPMVALVE